MGASRNLPPSRRLFREAEVELHDVVDDGRQGWSPRAVVAG